MVGGLDVEVVVEVVGGLVVVEEVAVELVEGVVGGVLVEDGVELEVVVELPKFKGL